MIPGRIPGRERWEVEDKLILSNSSDNTGELKIYAGKAGEKALEIFYEGYSVFHILATGSTVMLMGGSVKPVQIGDAGLTSHTLNTNDDLFVSGKLEVDGQIHFDGEAIFYNGGKFPDGQAVRIGSAADANLLWSIYNTTSHTFITALGNTSKSVIFTTVADALENFDHAAQTNPTIFVHSDTTPDTANDEWISISHDVTDGVIAVGSGTLNLGGSTVNFVNATRTGSGDAVMDGYATLEIGGTPYKFMLTA